MHIVEFNFDTKQERPVGVGDIQPRTRGLFYWVIIEPGEEEPGRQILDILGAAPEAIAGLLAPPQEARYDLYETAIHFSVSEAWLEADGLKSGVVEFLLGPHYLAVNRSSPSPVINQMLRVYREDFVAFARSSGFLLFELASHLFESYRRTYHNFTAEVERTQLTLFGEVSDDIFMQVSKLTADILSFRRMVLASRDLFKELATRKSIMVSETTQPSLDLLAGRMERLGDDLDSERMVLTETLNLYMGMVGHRTNRIINRLTIFSMIFLPLSFLCGVYGMNFAVMPELEWEYAYPAFWLGAVIFVISFVVFIKRKRWI